jgi:hypothetical protein
LAHACRNLPFDEYCARTSELLYIVACVGVVGVRIHTLRSIAYLSAIVPMCLSVS